MKPVILIVLDGFGTAPPGPGNAIYLARPNNINQLLYSFPNTTLRASGESVGLPASEVGNTEVGHINIGAGRIIFQDLPRINMSIADGSFFKCPAFSKAVKHVKATGGKLHLLGLVSQATVHSSIEHLFALLYLAKENSLSNVCVHAITDGRDSPPKSAGDIIHLLEQKLKELKIGQIGSVIGRYFAMDRDRRWERSEKAYRCLTEVSSISFATASLAIENAYKEGKTDEFIDPSVIQSPMSTRIEKGDSVIFFNYRIDRPRQLSKAFVLDNFENQANQSFSFDPYSVKYYKTHFPKEEIVSPPFQRGTKIADLCFVTMTRYGNFAADVAYPSIVVENPLGQLISSAGYEQLRMSESEKERFVTYYFNGLREEPFLKEDRLIIPSPKVATYDMKPEMSIYELTSMLLTKMSGHQYAFTLVNIANPDMVGHTGNIEATVKSIQTVDSCIGKIVSEGLKYDYTIFITADHGNAEQKINPQTGEISTEHTNNPVPFIAINQKWQGKFAKLQTGILADIAPTILNILGIPKPEEMTGHNLLEGVI